MPSPERPLRELRQVLAALADLVLPAGCAGCERAGPGAAPLCRGCGAALAEPAQVRPPTPSPPGMPPPWSAAGYAGPVRAALLAHKEHGRRALAGPLGQALGRAVVTAVREAGAAGPVLVVPVPSTPAAVRRRGRDPLLELARVAVDVAGRAGCPAVLAPVLRQVRRPADQAGLSSAARRANLDGALGLRPMAAAPALAGAQVVLVDDVVTTGATLAEAARALRAGAATVPAAAVVAATVRRSPPAPARPVAGGAVAAKVAGD
jgi:predicted amidophosphoribosyltransferase